MYLPKNFILQEFFPRDFFERTYPILGRRMWQLIDNRILWTADALRGRYGPMIINDWFWRKGNPNANQYRGFRPFDCKVGAAFSQHKFGRALDCVFRRIDVKDVIEEIKNHDYGEVIEFKYITTLEVGVSWLHIDCRNHAIGKYGIKLISP